MPTFGVEDYTGMETAESRSGKPIWTLPLDDPKAEPEILRWLNAEYDYLLQKNANRIAKQNENLSLYKGLMNAIQEQRSTIRETSLDRARFPRKMVVNELYDLVEQRVSRLIKYKPGIAILPANDEFGDKTSAKITKALLDTIWYNTRFDTKLIESAVRISDICGESFTFVEWDPDAGDLHPEYVKLLKQGGEIKIPLMNSSGDIQKDRNGQDIYIEQAIHVGDVVYKIVLPTKVLVEPVQDWEEVNYLFRTENVYTDLLRIKYKDLASKIVDETDIKAYDSEELQDMSVPNQSSVRRLYHRRCSPMPRGRYIEFTRTCILQNTELPYTMEMELPVERLTDIEIPGQLHAESFFSQTKQIQGHYNNLTSMIVKNQLMAAHPKWVMPVGSAKVEALGNDITIVQYKGPTPPMLVQSSPTPQEVFVFRQTLKDDLQRLSGIFGVSRGEPPPGIKAGVALQFLSEQEHERQNSKVVRFNEYIRSVAQKTLSVAGDFYDASDERIIRVVGKNNQWLVEHFDAAHLSKPYDIRVQNSSALPNSKAGRTQMLLDLNEGFPGMISGNQVLDLLDLSQDEKFYDLTTQSVRAAESEDEDFMDKKEVAEPTVEEDHITHWNTHVMMMRDRSFKMNASPEMVAAIKDHMLAHEMFMVQFGQNNPVYMQKLSMIDGFPLFFKVMDQPQAPMPVSPEEQMAAQQAVGVEPEEQLPANPEQPPIEQAIQGEALPPTEIPPAMPVGGE